MIRQKVEAALAGIVGLATMPGIFWDFSRLGYQRKSTAFADDAIEFRDKTVAITGANSGIGRAAAAAIAERGGRVLLLCRDQQRGQEAVDALQTRCAHGGSVALVMTDMADLFAVRRAAADLADTKIDVLVHNAGALNSERQITRDNLELDFALNLAGPHLLIHLLLPQLLARRGRVVFVSSGGMYSERLCVAEMKWANRRYDGLRAYAQVKRGQVALAQLWAAKYSGLDVRAMHPGWVDTPGVERSMPRFYRRLGRWLRSPDQGADTIVWLAGCNELPGNSGDFCFDRESVARYLLPKTRESPADREALWTALEAVC